MSEEMLEETYSRTASCSEAGPILGDVNMKQNEDLPPIFCSLQYLNWKITPEIALSLFCFKETKQKPSKRP